MKILLVSSNKDWRGSEQVIDSLFNHTTDNVDYYLYCKEHSDLQKKNEQKKNKVFTFKKSWIFLLPAAIRLKKICNKMHIDLIHLNDSHSINIYISACFLGLKVPAVLHRHVNIPITNAWKYNYPKIINVFCVSNEVKSTASKTIPEEKLTVIYPGISVSRYSTKKDQKENFIKELFSIPEDAKVIGIISAIAKEKNIIEFIEIANKCIEKDKNYHFIIVGGGSLYKTYKATYSNRNIHFTGFYSDIRNVFSCLDIFLFTSQNEGFCLVLLESMAAKIPLVCHYFPCINELLENEKTGFIYRDMNDAIAKLELLINNNTLRDNITNNAYEFVQQFDVTLMCEQIEEKYKELLNPSY